MGMMILQRGRAVVIPGIGVQVHGVRSTVAAGGGTWWDNNGAISGCVAAYQPKGAADLAASYINLANPGTYNAAPGVAPTFSSADGWTFNGSTQFLTTGIVPAAGWSMIIRFSDVSGTGIPVGSTPTNGLFWVQPSNGSAHRYAYGGSVVASGSPLTAGVMAIAAENCYLNGSADGTGSGGFTSSGVEIYVGARNAGGINAPCNCKIQALAIYSSTLTAGEVATITTAMNAL